jgi:drug/metabolite transporter (DMT)-like permease
MSNTDLHWKVSSAWVSILLIWSTVPLAIRWTVAGSDYILGATSRMVIGAAALTVAMLLTRTPWPRSPKAIRVYLWSTLNFGTFLMLYWALQYIPSGWIGIVWGTTPLVTAVFSALWLGERSLTPPKVSGLILGLAGVGVVFGKAADVSWAAVLGLLGALFGVATGAASAVAIKRLDARVPPLAIATTGVGLTAIAYALIWLLAAPPLPVALDARTLGAMLYMGVIGTGAVFALYYYALEHVTPVRLAIIGMLNPILILLLGHLGNDEPLGLRVAVGTALVVAALALHEYVPRRHAPLT